MICFCLSIIALQIYCSDVCTKFFALNGNKASIYNHEKPLRHFKWHRIKRFSDKSVKFLACSISTLTIHHLCYLLPTLFFPLLPSLSLSLSPSSFLWANLHTDCADSWSAGRIFAPIKHAGQCPAHSLSPCMCVSSIGPTMCVPRACGQRCLPIYRVSLWSLKMGRFCAGTSHVPVPLEMEWRWKLASRMNDQGIWLILCMPVCGGTF